MDGSARRYLSWVSYRLLVVALVLGVAGMHTLGHLGMEHARGGVSMMAGHVPAAESRMTPPFLAEAREEATLSRLGGMLPGLDPTTVCLAVLTSFMVLLLVVVAMWVRRGSEAAEGDPA